MINLLLTLPPWAKSFDPMHIHHTEVDVCVLLHFIQNILISKILQSHVTKVQIMFNIHKFVRERFFLTLIT